LDDIRGLVCRGSILFQAKTLRGAVLNPGMDSNRLAVSRDLQRIFDYRVAKVAELFGN
jgi:hypothetical protein